MYMGVPCATVRSRGMLSRSARFVEVCEVSEWLETARCLPVRLRRKICRMVPKSAMVAVDLPEVMDVLHALGDVQGERKFECPVNALPVVVPAEEDVERALGDDFHDKERRAVRPGACAKEADDVWVARALHKLNLLLDLGEGVLVHVLLEDLDGRADAVALSAPNLAKCS